MESSNKTDYFMHRNINSEFYDKYKLPFYFRTSIPSNKDINILDIGCGFGQMLTALRLEGYKNLLGIDISSQAVENCKSKGLKTIKINNLKSFCNDYRGDKFDLIIASHVMEHLEKSAIVENLGLIRNKLLKDSGTFLATVPNAQSNTGCYWAYEDFTHSTLFTSGSLYFVLKSAGFDTIEFLDPDGLEETPVILKPLKKLLLSLYKINKHFWNRVTSSSFHDPSPQIFTYELKVLAR